ncbi:hypothetical protein [Mariniflexile sp. HMF6888]|uniref:hypothetical protein n=1 Tax=Mariniflexile sp. HMF6888 TaxID=3373086 RepID=UPI0037A31593
MKRITCIILFSLFAMNLQGQCDSISKEILNIIKKEKYERFGNLLMPIEQYRKILHWPISDETDKVLLTIKDSLKNGLIASAKKLRIELLDKGFDLKKMEFNRCELTGSKLDIFISDNEKESNFIVETQKTDKIYLMLPINELAPELPTFRPTKEELANSTIIIAGEKFKPFEPSEIEKEKGLEILKRCIDFQKKTNKNILLTDGMKDKNGLSILTFITVGESDINRYKVILEKKTCEKE